MVRFGGGGGGRGKGRDRLRLNLKGCWQNYMLRPTRVNCGRVLGKIMDKQYDIHSPEDTHPKDSITKIPLPCSYDYKASITMQP